MQKKIQSPPVILTYDDAARFEGIQTPAFYKRARRGRLHRIEMGRGRNGKPIWGIPLTQLTASAQARYWQSLPGAARQNVSSSTGTQTSESLEAPASGRLDANRPPVPPPVEPAAPPIPHDHHDLITHHVSRIAHPLPGSLLAPLSTALVPLTTTGAVDEAALVAMGRDRALGVYHHRIRAILDLEHGQAGLAHGDRLESLARIARQHELPIGTLRRWQGLYRKRGADALVPQWGKTEGCSSVPRGLRTELLAAWHTPLSMTFAQAFRYAIQWCRDRLVVAPSQHAVRRFILKHASNPQIKTALRKGKKAHAQHHRYHLVRNPNDLPVNGVWCGDHRIADVWVLRPDGSIGRPWITAFEDVRSGRFVGWVVREQVTSDGVAAALRRGILGWTEPGLDGQPIAFSPCGLPEILYLDHGKEFHGGAMTDRPADLDGQAAATIFNTLGVRRLEAIPYQAWSKPIEAAFSSWAHAENQLCGYCGRNAQAKPELLKRLAEKGQLLSLAQYRAWLAAHFATANATRPLGHLRDLPPNAYYEGAVLRHVEPAQLDTLLLRATNRVLQNHGFDLPGLGRYMSEDPRLILLIGSRFELRYTADDPSAIQAFEPRTGERFSVPRIPDDNAWSMLLGGQPSEQFRHAQRVRSTQRSILQEAAAEVAATVNVRYLDPTGTYRAAAVNRPPLPSSASLGTRHAARGTQLPDRSRLALPAPSSSDLEAADKAQSARDALRDFYRARGRAAAQREAQIEALALPAPGAGPDASSP